MDKCQKSSYLSNNVKKLVCFQPNDLAWKKCCENIFFESGLLNWSTIEKLCNECFLYDGESDYILAVSQLYPISCQVHACIYQLTTEEFELKYENHLGWTTKSRILLQCFALLKSPKLGSLVTSLLLLTSTLERILGDIFLSCSDEAATCPSLLKDLLKTRELRSVLGESFMFCLEVLIGSPCGLNLRNLAWHGFLAEEELPVNFVSFMLMLTISLAETMKAQTKQPRIESLIERPLIKYSEFTIIKEVFPEVEIENLSELFSKSNFVTSSMVQMWQLMLDFFQHERYEYVVMILLPQLEHSMRRLYASVNKMPERVETAESAEFYTTFNEILSPVLSNGDRNKLLDSLKPCFIELLLDILVHPEGPRIRDHLSHGEIDTLHFPKSLANHVLCIASAFCLRFCREDLSEISNFSAISIAAQDYSSIFHPFSGFQREFSIMIGSLLEWKKLNRPIDAEFQQICNGNVFDKPFKIELQIGTEDLHDERLWTKIPYTILKQVLHGNSSIVEESVSRGINSICDQRFLNMAARWVTKCKLDTLFRPRYELEVVALMRQVVGHCTRTADQIQRTAKASYIEWEQRALRSRQRNNYKRLWYFLPVFAQTLCLLTVVIAGEFVNVQNRTGSDVRKNRFLKKCLQCSENMASMSSHSRNRWLECAEAGKLWREQVVAYYDEQHVSDN